MKKFHHILPFVFLAQLAAAQVFKGESVEYDPIGHRFLTSDDGTAIVQRAADGTVSYFGTGTKASYGMEVMNGQLWAIEGKDIIGYDLPTAAQIGKANIPDATFLNGLAADSASKKLWATDFSTKKIYEIDVADPASPVVKTLVANFVSQPNGVVFDEKNNRLVVASWGASSKIKAVNLADGTLTTLVTTSLTNIDGIDNDAAGNFYLASWSPARITKYDPGFTIASTITVAGGVSQPADITYARQIDTIAIPNVGTNSIKFVGFPPPVSAGEAENSGISMKISPNPTAQEILVDFVLAKKSTIEASILTTDGRTAKRLIFVKMPPGANRAVIDNLMHLAPGHYFLQFKIGQDVFVRPFVKV